MTNTVKLKRGSGSDPSASDMVVGEPVIRTDTAELFFKKDDGSVAKVSGGGGGPDFKYLALRNAANNGSASYPGNDFTLVTSGTTNAITPAAANTLLVSYGGVIQRPNSGTSTSGITGFIVDGSRFKTATNLAAAPDFILYQESGGIGEPSDNTVTSAKIVDGAIVNADINASAAIAGTKISPSFTSNITIENAEPKLLLTDSGQNPDYTISNTNGTFKVTSSDGGGTDKIKVNTDGSVDITANLDCESGIDVTGNITVTGTVDGIDIATDVAANTAKVTNATHSGEVTGATALTIADNVVDEANLKVSNSPTNGYFLSAQSGNTGGLTWATVPAGVGGATGVDFNDDVKARWGTGNDLEIFHDGSHSYIKDVGTGNLYIEGNASVNIDKYSGEQMANFIADGAVELFYDNTKRIETSGTGATITGVATVSNGIVETAATIATNHTITSNYNAMSAGPVTVSATVTVPSGSAWVIV